MKETDKGGMNLLSKSGLKYLTYSAYLISLLLLLSLIIVRAAYYDMGTLLLSSLALIPILTIVELVWLLKRGLSWVQYSRVLISFLIVGQHTFSLFKELSFNDRYLEFLIDISLLTIPIFIVVFYWVKYFSQRHAVK